MFYFALSLCYMNISLISCLSLSTLPAFAPDAPTIVNKNKLINDRSFVLRWTRSTADNGRPILRYLVFCRELYSNSSKEAWKKKDAGINLYYNLTLKWAASYQFAVAAENDQGESKKSKIKSFNVVPGK